MNGGDAIEFDVERFQTIRQLGVGGMGVVYEVLDRQRNVRVALKTLIKADAASIYRFKREFRALADITHPNLISLYELMSTDRRWFFTMELLDGLDFVRHMRDSGETAASMRPADYLDSTVVDPTSSMSPRRGTASAPRDFDKLRAGLRQLAEGVAALHAAGKVHRDIKPSNVLVCRDGRVVLLDFGLISDAPLALGEGSTVGHFAGTPPYMSPEQLARRAVGPESDWYSVGLVLYQALTGTVPHVDCDSILQLAERRQREPAPSPRALCPDVPADLDELCAALLAPDATRRPTDEAMLRRVASDAPATVSPTRATSSIFVGREAELRALSEASAAARQQRVVVHIWGESGIGKSAVLDHFLQEQAQAHPTSTVTLRARCYERESMPYKALDPLVDSLCRHLGRLDPREVRTLLPRHLWALAQLFPVLERIDGAPSFPPADAALPEPREVRRLALLALRDLLSRIAARQRVVLAIDDLQWGDADSGALLSEALFGDGEPMSLMLVLACRGEDRARSPFLGAFRVARNVDVRHVELGPLPPAETRELARRLLGATDGVVGHAAQLAHTVARESGGVPLFVGELMHFLPSLQAEATDRAISFEKMLAQRLETLSPSERRLLEVVAVASRPLGEEVAASAAELTAEARQATFDRLRAAKLIRKSADGVVVETFHDRIREALLKRLDGAVLRAHHRRLAQALESSAHVDPELLAAHYVAAHEAENAGVYALRAADQAMAALAFDRAVRLYRLALDLLPAGDGERPRLHVGLADALSYIGRCSEAAVSYLKAAELAGADQSRTLRRLAAEQLLKSGHLDEGFDVMRDLLASLGVPLPETRRRAILGVLGKRAWLRTAGLGFRRLGSSTLSALEADRIDTCWGLGTYLSSIDPIRGAYFQASSLLLSLRAGDKFRITRALSSEAAYYSLRGESGRAYVDQLLDLARELAKEIDRPYTFAFIDLVEGIIAFMCEERWQKSFDLCQRAEAVFRERCRGASWEITNGQFFSLNALMVQGKLSALASRLPAALAIARDLGDLFADSFLRFRFSSIIWLATDQTAHAHEENEQLRARFSARDFYIQHYWDRHADVQLLIYTGDGERAWSLTQDLWQTLKKSLLLRTQFHRIDALFLHARGALAAAEQLPSGSERDELVRVAARDAAKLAGHQPVRARSMAQLVRAGIAALAGDVDRATLSLYAAADGFDAASMGLHAAICRRRYGELVGGDRGSAMVAAADAWMENEQIKSPTRFARLYAPGFASP
jgi:eukaryotic-like serine/threonine-protein kinase